MQLLLVRHGQTEESKSGIILGQNGGTLSEEGRASAQKLAPIIKDIHPDAVYVSDLQRCLDTAQLALSTYPISAYRDKRLREINFGSFQGEPYSVVKDDYPSDLTKKFPGGESNSQLITRVIDFVNDIYEAHKNDVVLVITHSGPINTIISAIYGVTYADNVNNQIKHCEILRYNIDGKLPYAK